MCGTQQASCRRSVVDPTDVVLNISTMTLWRSGRSVSFHSVTPHRAPRAVRLLILLLTTQQQSVSYRDIIESLWCDDPDGGPEHAKSGVAQTVATLRSKVDPLGLSIISRRRPYGYYLIDHWAEQREAA